MTEQQQDLRRFYTYLESERRYSPHTLSAYRRDISQFMAYCSEQAITGWAECDKKLVRQFVATQHRKGLSGRSLQRQLSAIRTLFNFLMRHQLANANPAKNIPAPRAAKRLPATLGVDQLNNLLTTKDTDALTIRDSAMMELLYGCGLRLSELTGLDLNNIDWQQQTLLVLGKGSKQRRVPFGHKARVALESWLQQRVILLKQGIRPCLSAVTAPVSAIAVFSSASRKGRCNRVSTAISIPTCSDTRLPRIYWNLPVIFAPCRSCWDMPI